MEFDLTYVISAPGDTRMIRFDVAIPQTIENKQKVIGIRYSRPPTRIINRKGNRYAEFTISRPDKQTKIVVTVKAELYRYDLSTAMMQSKHISIDKSQLEKYLRHEKNIEKNNPAIRQVAGSIEGGTEINTIRKIYDYVIENLEYSLHGRRELGAANVLRSGKGDCTEYSHLFVALCRAKKIPARVVTGYAIGTSEISAKHNWAEVYLENYGWIPFDPTSGDVRNINIRNMAFSQMRPVYVYLYDVNNDDTLRDYHYAWYSFWGDAIRIRDLVRFRRLD